MALTERATKLWNEMERIARGLDDQEVLRLRCIAAIALEFDALVDERDARIAVLEREKGLCPECGGSPHDEFPHERGCAQSLS